MPAPAKKPAARKKATTTIKYGCQWPTTDPVAIELACITYGGQWLDPHGNVCGMGTAHHMMEFDKLVWPWIQHHRWQTGLIVPELSRPNHRAVIWGPSSTGKSHTVSATYLKYYFARPSETTVLLASTTKDELNLRIWGEIKMLFVEAKEKFPWLPGHMIDSAQMILTDAKDSEFGRDARNGIICRPCRKGTQWLIGSGASPFMGIKNKYVFFAGDEAGVMPKGFLEAFANLDSNEHFSCAVMGNLGDLDTPLGEAAEPEFGWDSLSDSDVSRVYNTRWSNGRAVQLIGKDSPNLDYPEGAEPYKKLIGRGYLKRMAENYGLDTPLYNMFAAGKIPRSSMDNRVITKQVCYRFNAFDEVEWGSTPLTRVYGADLSYTSEHGDKSVGIPLEFGLDREGKLRISQLERPLIFTPNDRSIGSIEDQIALQMRAECERLKIPAEHVFYDGTGRSSFTASVMRLWSTSVNPIEFGGQASKRPNFLNRRYQEDKGPGKQEGGLLPCSEVFGKFVTELWFAWRYCIEAGQLRGLSEEVAKEGYLRLWKVTKGNLTDVEPKDEIKKRLGRSPDLADALVSGLEGARQLGFKLGQLNADKEKPKSRWLSHLRKEYEQSRASLELTTS